jgi:hypothetical protein
MNPLSSLLLPILISSVFVFFASWILNTLLPHHRTDFRPLPEEDEVQAALRRAGHPTPGDYAFPYASTVKQMGEPAYVEKRDRGPVGFLTITPSGPPRMGTSLAQWFVFTLVVSTFAAYLTSRAVPTGADYGSVFRFAGTTAFAAYALALWQQSIWYGRSWSTTLKGNLDGLVYALITGGVFGWLWP